MPNDNKILKDAANYFYTDIKKSKNELQDINQKIINVNLNEQIKDYKDKYESINISSESIATGERIKTWERMNLDKAIDLFISKSDYITVLTPENVVSNTSTSLLFANVNDYQIAVHSYFFLINNFKDFLRISLESLSKDMDQLDKDTTNSEFLIKTYLWFSCCTLICLGLLCLLPVILRSTGGIHSILGILTRIDKKDLTPYIISSKIYVEESTLPFETMASHFQSMESEFMYLQQDEKTISVDSPEIQEQKIKATEAKMGALIKNRGESVSSSSITVKLKLEILLGILIILAFYGTSFYFQNQEKNRLIDSINIRQIIQQRVEWLDRTHFFFLYALAQEEPPIDPQGNDLTNMYLNRVTKIERELIDNLPKIKEFSNTMYDSLENLNSYKACSTLKEFNAHQGNLQSCLDLDNKLLESGIGNSIFTFHLEISDKYSQILNILKQNNTSNNFSAFYQNGNNENLVNITDMKILYIAAILEENLELCRAEIRNLLDEIKKLQDVSFYLSLILILGLFILTMIEAIHKFNIWILNTKKLISIIPTNIASFQLSKMKKAFNALS